jgi:23S rRNA pseudouridine1911/1915/1917 synthase
VWDQKALIQKADARDPRAAQAVSEYRVIESFSDTALIEVRLQTGKRNQIRIQAALRGHPLIGERQYGNDVRGSAIDFPRQALHAHRLSFRHPMTGRVLTFEAPLPKDLVVLTDRLRSRT